MTWSQWKIRNNKTMHGLLALSVAVGAGVTGASGCLDRPLCSTDCVPQTTNVLVSKYENTSVDQIDLLFMIDNSSSMKDKQDVLRAAVPDLVGRLVNPRCVDPNGAPAPTQPSDPSAACPGGFAREFTAIDDIHIGIVTSSVGDHGAGTTCPQSTSTPLMIEEDTDDGRLVGSRGRAGPNAPAPFVDLYSQSVPPDPAGFLNWHPKTVANETTPDAFTQTFADMVFDADQQGCGFEAQLESWYRFLADPAPPASVDLVACPGAPSERCAKRTGLDQTLLDQRKAFLRPNSLLAVIMLTDENDCSIEDKDQAYLVADGDWHAPNGSSACGTNPNDPCCYSCQIGPPPGSHCLTPDPVCSKSAPQQDRGNGNFNLRCFQQKARFGVDFLYPTARYVNALKSPELCTSLDTLAVTDDPRDCPDADGDGMPDLMPNPIYSDLTGGGAAPRSQDLVFFGGIIGVPWQDIQTSTRADGSSYPAGELHYKTASTMLSDGTWDTILGNSNASPPVLPNDGLMVESTSPRGSGPADAQNPLVGPSGPRFGTMGSNPSNGHDWTDVAQGDLEYACIFPLPPPNGGTASNGDCSTRDPGDDNPLCQNPDGTYGTTQYFAKGYPDLRELQVLKDFGDNSIVASLCAQQVTDTTQQNYGYRPAIDAIVDRLKEQLANKCLPRALVVDPITHDVPCNILEAGLGAEFADCTRVGRAAAEPALVDAARDNLASQGSCTKGAPNPTLPACNDFNICEITPAGHDCHTTNATSAGWCYIDPKNGDPASLVASCPAIEKRILRFVGPDTPAHGGVTLIACQGAQFDDTTESPSVTPSESDASP
jgi:hypothetical protein